MCMTNINLKSNYLKSELIAVSLWFVNEADGHDPTLPATALRVEVLPACSRHLIPWIAFCKILGRSLEASSLSISAVNSILASPFLLA